MTQLEQIGAAAKAASRKLNSIGTAVKDEALLKIANALTENSEYILSENRRDLERAAEHGMSKAMLDRLTLSEKRISDMAEGVRKVASLPDPIGEVSKMWTRPNGLTIGKKVVPMGVIAIIYEARPNVTADAAALCLKTSNAVILRGGSEAIYSNLAIMKVMQSAAYSAGIPTGSLNILEDTSRETATELMRLRAYVDLLIPRGGAGLIRSVVENASVPVIETAAGNCHIYVNKDYDEKKAIDILLNAKVSRPAVCNAAETLLIDRDIAEEFVPMAFKALRENNVEIRACEECRKIDEKTNPASEDDWYAEYDDYIIAAKIVDDLDDAINHINKYNTGHSECIVTENYTAAQRFLDEIDAAAVYVNASTRFTDGFEFGFGAEIGISTQKLHARGPMGLSELTSYKYIIYGNGQVR